MKNTNFNLRTNFKNYETVAREPMALDIHLQCQLLQWLKTMLQSENHGKYHFGLYDMQNRQYYPLHHSQRKNSILIPTGDATGMTFESMLEYACPFQRCFLRALEDHFYRHCLATPCDRIKDVVLNVFFALQDEEASVRGYLLTVAVVECTKEGLPWICSVKAEPNDLYDSFSEEFFFLYHMSLHEGSEAAFRDFPSADMLLSKREKEFIMHLYNKDDISGKMFISKDTVRKHNENIRAKFRLQGGGYALINLIDDLRLYG